VKGWSAVPAVRDLAVATSGLYERGDHILDPHSALPARGLLSMTVSVPASPSPTPTPPPPS